jgi:hypothetical protein
MSKLDFVQNCDAIRNKLDFFCRTQARLPDSSTRNSQASPVLYEVQF